MQFALNYSPEAHDLIDNGQIEIDVYKCPNWPDMIADAQQQRPAYVHFPLMAGRRNIEQMDMESIEHFLTQTGTHYVTMHLAPRASDFDDMPLDTCDPAKTEQLAEAMLEDITGLARHFGPEKVILENVPWDPEPKYAIPRPALETDIIRRMVYESGCGFLLDTAHARIAAKYLGVDERDYIASLPVDRIRELHITGLKFNNEAELWQDHFAMTDEDWAIAEWVMGHIHAGEWAEPWALVLEYGGSGAAFAYRSKPEVMLRDVPRLYALAHPLPTQTE